jgi:hypothetical protein
LFGSRQDFGAQYFLAHEFLFAELKDRYMDPACYSMPAPVQPDRNIVFIKYFELDPFTLQIFYEQTFKVKHVLNSPLSFIHPLDSRPPSPPRIGPWQSPVAAGAPYCISFQYLKIFFMHENNFNQQTFLL